MGNLLSQIPDDNYYSYIFYKNEGSIKDAQAYADFEQVLQRGSIQGKNILHRKDKDNNNFNSTIKFLEDMAQRSLLQECAFYDKIFGETKFSKTVMNAAASEKPDYMSTLFEGASLEQTLTFKVLGIENEKVDSGKYHFIQILSSLNTDQILGNTEASAMGMVFNIFDTGITNAFNKMKLKRFNKAKNMMISSRAQIEVMATEAISENLVFKDYDEKDKDKFIQDQVKLLTKNLGASRDPNYKGAAAAAGAKEILLNGDPSKAEGLWQERNEILNYIITFVVEQVADYMSNSGLSPEEMTQIATEMVKDVLKHVKATSGSFKINTKTKNTLTISSASYKSADLRKYLEEKYSHLFETETKNLSSELDSLKQPDSYIINVEKQTLNESMRSLVQMLHSNIINFISSGGRRNISQKAIIEAIKYYNSIIPQINSEIEKDYLKEINSTKDNPATSQLWSELQAINNSLEQLTILQQDLNSLQELINILVPDILEGKDAEKIRITLSKIITHALKTGGKNFSIEGIEYSESSLIKMLNSDDIGNLIDILDKRITEKAKGYISSFNGSIGEIYFTIMTRLVLGQKMTTAQFGRARNELGQQAHADMGFYTGTTLNEGWGIQAKIYKTNKVDLYKDTKVSFDADEAIRYLGNKKGGKKELTAFRFFIINNSILEEIDANLGYDGYGFLQVLEERLDYFIRYSDGLTSLGELKNNFFMINFNLIPASAIFFAMMDYFKEKNNSSLITTTLKFPIVKESDYANLEWQEKTVNSEKGINLLSGNKAIFKGFTINLDTLGISTFNK